MCKNNSLIFVSGLLFLNCYAGQSLYKMLYYNSLIPADTALRSRVLTTVCCDDCSFFPRVQSAGNIVMGDDGSSYQIMHNGIKIGKDCYYGSWMTTIIELLKGHHEPQEEKAFHEVLNFMPQNAVMLELGSYWGYYSMWFQQKVSGAKNFLIEPDPKNLLVGQKNFALNGMNGYFTQAMIGPVSLESQVFTDWDHNTYNIKQLSVDDFAAQNAIDFIHILHSDIQGAELEMLKGCQRLIAEKRIGYFFISTHRGAHQNCLKLLEDANFTILLSITREESFSADGLIIAKLPEIGGPSLLDVSRRTLQFCNLIEEVVKG